MAFLEWKSEFSVNNDRLDLEHQELVELLNSLHEGMKGGRLHDVMGDILDKVIDHTRRHFASEEELMRAEGFPGLDSHRNAHRALTDQINNLHLRYHSGGMILSNEVLQFLREWLIGHMVSMDREFGNFLGGNGHGEHKDRLP